MCIHSGVIRYFSILICRALKDERALFAPWDASLMRVVLACFLAFSVLVQSDQALAADDQWAGFWRLEQRSEFNNPVFFLWISSSGRLVLFDDEWKDLHLASESGSQGDDLKLSQYFRGGQIVWSGRRDGDSLEGDWEFLHFQYHTKGSFSGTRRSRVELTDWDPLEASHASTTEDRVLNLTARLHEKAGDEEGFREYWENTFVPQFLPFLPNLPEHSVAWTTLQNDQEVAVSREFDDHATNLAKLLKKNFPLYEHPYDVVITPFGAQRKRAIVAESPFLLINPRLFVEGIEQDRLRISQRILAAQLYPYTRMYKKESGSVFKLGLELFLLEQAYPEELPEILGVKEKRLAQLQEQLPKFKERMGAGKKLKDDEKRYLSLAFARALATSYPFRGVLKSRPEEIVKRLVEYLHVLPKQAAGRDPASRKKPKK